MIWRILLSVPLWLAYAGTALVFDIIGVPLCAVLAYTRAWTVRPSRVYGAPRADGKEVYIGVWKGGWLTWLWSNEEDGLIPQWWYDHNPTWSNQRLAFIWSALRNPSNNMRFIPGINPVIDPKRVQYYYRVGKAGSTSLTYTWQGIFSGLLVIFPLAGHAFRFWIGWKLKPEDVLGVADSDMRKPRCGFATQFKRIG